MVSEEFSQGIAETLDILNYMDKIYIEKIPKKFKDFLEKNKSKSYVSHLNHSKKVNEMKLKEKTKDILSILYMMYWCSSEEKTNYSKLLKQNDEKNQKELSEKYNPDNIFETKDQISININNQIQDDVSLIERKDSFFIKVIKRIKNIFHIK